MADACPKNARPLTVLTAETTHQEWLRISHWVKASKLTVYDPKHDPGAVEYPPLIRFKGK